MTKTALLLTCAVGALSCLANAATAATPADNSTSTPSQVTSLTEIIVTAERRDQSLQEVPIAVTAFTPKQRDLVGIESLEDMTAFAPGLVYSSGLDHLYVRGVGRQSTDLAAPAGVATFVDGFYNPDPILAILPPLFSQDIDVLRGPQGTLGGRNGIAGALMINARRPTAEPYAEVRATAGNYGYTDIEAAVSGPIKDGLNFRLAASDTQQSQGYFTNVGRGASEGGVIREYHVEGAVTAKFGEHLDLYARATATDWTNGAGGAGARISTITAPYSTFLNDQSSAFIFNPAAGYNPGNILPGSLNQDTPGLNANPSTADPRKFAGNVLAHVSLKDAYSVNGTATYHFPKFDLKYTGGYAQYTYTNIAPPGQLETDVNSYVVPQTLNLGFGTNPTCAASANPFTTCLTVHPKTVLNYVQSEKWYSHELTFASTGDGPVQWIGGLYFYDEKYSNPVQIGAPEQDQVATPCYIGAGAASANCAGGLGVGSAPANPTRDLLNIDYKMESRSEAAYGQIDWKITDAFKLTGGLRYTHDRVGGTEYLRTVFFGGSSLVSGGAAFYATPQMLGAATPALDLTPLLCAADNASPNHKGETSLCVVGANGVASRGLNDSSSAVTGTAGVSWTPDRSTLIYARYSRGYKSLGFNAGYDLIGSPAAEVAPETMNDYELGFKKSWGRTLVVNATLYYEDYLNAQIPLAVQTAAGAQNLLTSLPKSRSDGIEVEAQWSPVEHLQINVSYAFNDTAVLSACTLTPAPTNCFVDAANPNGGGQNVRGNPLPNAPRNKLSLNGNYTFVFEPGSLTLSASYFWRDQQYGSIFKAPWWVAPSSSDVDLRATWQASNDRYAVVLFAKNVFDAKQYEAGAITAISGNAATPAVYSQYQLPQLDPPRTYGIELRYKFF